MAAPGEKSGLSDSVFPFFNFLCFSVAVALIMISPVYSIASLSHLPVQSLHKLPQTPKKLYNEALPHAVIPPFSKLSETVRRPHKDASISIKPHLYTVLPLNVDPVKTRQTELPSTADPRRSLLLRPASLPVKSQSIYPETRHPFPHPILSVQRVSADPSSDTSNGATSFPASNSISKKKSNMPLEGPSMPSPMNSCENVYDRAVARAANQFSEWDESLAQGKPVPDFGKLMEKCRNSTLHYFRTSVSPKEAIPGEIARFLVRLTSYLETRLYNLYVLQISLLRQHTLEMYERLLATPAQPAAPSAAPSTDTKSSTISPNSSPAASATPAPTTDETEAAASSTSSTSHTSSPATRAQEAFTQAAAFFKKQATLTTPVRCRSAWRLSEEIAVTNNALKLLSRQNRRLLDANLSHFQQQRALVQALQLQQRQLLLLQQQFAATATPSPFNVGLAYRFPDTNINLSGSYQQGRTSIQFSCVPDESAPLLGPNGFVHGVAPGNMGLSVTLNI